MTQQLAELRDLIANDSYAITFQTFGQYRTALLKAADTIAALASQGAQPAEGGGVMPDRLEEIIDEYLDGYTMEGDDSYHQPTEGERFMIKDAIMGLLVDDAWDAEWGAHIRSLCSPPAAAGEAVPEGFVLVPKEPTSDMRNAFHAITQDDREMKGAAGAAWAAMLSAAPQPKGEGSV